MNVFKKVMASEPILTIGGLVGTPLGIYLWNALPSDYRSMVFKVLGAMAAAGVAARQAAYAPDTHGADLVEATRRPIELAPSLDTGLEGVLPLPLEATANNVARAVAAKSGGLAGNLAEDTVNRVLGSASDVVSSKLGGFFKRGK